MSAEAAEYSDHHCAGAGVNEGAGLDRRLHTVLFHRIDLRLCYVYCLIEAMTRFWENSIHLHGVLAFEKNLQYVTVLVGSCLPCREEFRKLAPVVPLLKGTIPLFWQGEVSVRCWISVSSSRVEEIEMAGLVSCALLL